MTTSGAHKTSQKQNANAGCQAPVRQNITHLTVEPKASATLSGSLIQGRRVTAWGRHLNQFASRRWPRKYKRIEHYFSLQKVFFASHKSPPMLQATAVRILTCFGGADRCVKKNNYVSTRTGLEKGSRERKAYWLDLFDVRTHSPHIKAVPISLRDYVQLRQCFWCYDFHITITTLENMESNYCGPGALLTASIHLTSITPLISTISLGCRYPT